MRCICFELGKHQEVLLLISSMFLHDYRYRGLYLKYSLHALTVDIAVMVIVGFK